MIINTVLKRDISCKERILEYTRSFVELYESYPALAAILLNFETLMHYEHTRQRITEIFKKRSELIVKVIKIGQSTGEIENYYTTQELTDIINGTMMSIIQRWKISGYDYKLKECMLVTIKKVLDKC